jgi:hypothetical protein
VESCESCETELVDNNKALYHPGLCYACEIDLICLYDLESSEDQSDDLIGW